MSSTQTITALKIDTLVHRMHTRAVEQPEKVAYTFLRYNKANTANTESLTYKDLDQQARAIGCRLQEMEARGKPVLLLFPSGLAYISAYFGCLYAGAIAVPAYLPHSARDFLRIQTIVADTGADTILTTASDYINMARWTQQVPELARLTWITTDTLAPGDAEAWHGGPTDEHALAFLQYTSGSTSAPKGVMVSHANLMHNLAATHVRWKMAEIEKPACVSWLPIFHDMGLVMGILSPLYSGYPSYLMSPVDFLLRPLRWLQAISDYRGTFSYAPNFAYELCLRRISAEDRAQLDLSCWAGTGNGAEPVRSDTLERFSRFFAPCGFSQNAFRPGYGLAEATLLVTSGWKGEPVSIKAVNKRRLEEGYVEDAALNEAGEGSSAEQQVKYLVGCGRPFEDQQVVIVDPQTCQRCVDTQVGEIWIAGPSVAQGYWQRPLETAATFHAYLATGEGPFFRTGDLGVFQDDNLFITGRIKDVIILNGRNLYPNDIELTVEQAHPAVRAGNCVAFSYERDDEERLVVLAEINHRYRPQAETVDEARPAPLDTAEIIRCIRKAINEEHEVRAHEILLLRVGEVLKTSSGKLQRRACKQAFLQGTLKTWNAETVEIAQQ